MKFLRQAPSDALDAATGIVNGTLLSILFWLCVGLAVTLAMALLGCTVSSSDVSAADALCIEQGSRLRSIERFPNGLAVSCLDGQRFAGLWL